MRYWNMGDEGLLRALRSEHSSLAPGVGFAPGMNGGVAVYHEHVLAGVWIELRRHRYSFFLAPQNEAIVVDCDLSEAALVTKELIRSMGEEAALGAKLSA